MKFLAKNITFKNIEKFFLNNIKKLSYKIAKFAKSSIRIVANIIANSSNANFIPSEQIGNNPPINLKAQSEGNISNNKNISPSSSNNNYTQLNNNTHTKIEDDNENQFNTSLTVFMKNYLH